MKIKTVAKTVGTFVACVAINVASDLYKDYKASPRGMDDKTLTEYSNYKKTQFDAAMKLDSLINNIKNTKNIDSTSISSSTECLQTAVNTLKYTQNDIDRFKNNPDLKVKEDVFKNAKAYAEAKAEQLSRFNDIYN